jgi:hypothetical protein
MSPRRAPWRSARWRTAPGDGRAGELQEGLRGAEASIASKGSSAIPPLSGVPRHETINSVVLDGPRVVGKWLELFPRCAGRRAPLAPAPNQVRLGSVRGAALKRARMCGLEVA